MRTVLCTPTQFAFMSFEGKEREERKKESKSEGNWAYDESGISEVQLGIDSTILVTIGYIDIYLYSVFMRKVQFQW